MSAEASTQTRAVSKAVHAAGLALDALVQDGWVDDSVLEPLPTYYGHPWIAEPLSAADVAGLIEAHRRAREAERHAPEPLRELEVALMAMEAALLMLGLDPCGKREPVAPVIGNVERFGRDEADGW